MPSDFPNFRCDRESETVNREIKVHSEHQSHSENYHERSKGQSMHQTSRIEIFQLQEKNTIILPMI